MWLAFTSCSSSAIDKDGFEYFYDRTVLEVGFTQDTSEVVYYAVLDPLEGFNTGDYVIPIDSAKYHTILTLKKNGIQAYLTGYVTKEALKKVEGKYNFNEKLRKKNAIVSISSYGVIPK